MKAKLVSPRRVPACPVATSITRDLASLRRSLARCNRCPLRPKCSALAKLDDQIRQAITEICAKLGIATTKPTP